MVVVVIDWMADCQFGNETRACLATRCRFNAMRCDAVDGIHSQSKNNEDAKKIACWLSSKRFRENQFSRT